MGLLSAVLMIAGKVDFDENRRGWDRINPRGRCSFTRERWLELGSRQRVRNALIFTRRRRKRGGLCYRDQSGELLVTGGFHHNILNKGLLHAQPHKTVLVGLLTVLWQFLENGRSKAAICCPPPFLLKSEKSWFERVCRYFKRQEPPSDLRQFPVILTTKKTFASSYNHHQSFDFFEACQTAHSPMWPRLAR